MFIFIAFFPHNRRLGRVDTIEYFVMRHFVNIIHVCITSSCLREILRIIKQECDNLKVLIKKLLHVKCN